MDTVKKLQAPVCTFLSLRKRSILPSFSLHLIILSRFCYATNRGIFFLGHTAFAYLSLTVLLFFRIMHRTVALTYLNTESISMDVLSQSHLNKKIVGWKNSFFFFLSVGVCVCVYIYDSSMKVCVIKRPGLWWVFGKKRGEEKKKEAFFFFLARCNRIWLMRYLTTTSYLSLPLLASLLFSLLSVGFYLLAKCLLDELWFDDDDVDAEAETR